MRILLAIVLTAAVSAAADQLEDKPVVLAAPSFWCPYACDSEGEELGFSVEIALNALRSQGMEVRYQNMPYLRVQRQLKAGKIDGIVAAYKGEVDNAIFPKTPVSYSYYCFYSYQDISFDWKEDIRSLRPYKLIVTGGYSYSPEIDAYIADASSEVEILKGNNITTRGFDMLAHQRAHLFLEDAGLYAFMLKKRKVEPALNKGCLKTETLGYLALSATNLTRSQQIADAYDKGFIWLEESGQLQVILDKYNIQKFSKSTQN